MKKTQENSRSIFLWLDIFSYTQWCPKTEFSWWCDTFQKAVQEIGSTLLILAPWDDPRPLRRSWCLFEIYISVQSSCFLEIIMNEQQMNSFLYYMGSNGVMNGEELLDKYLSSINVEKSEAMIAEDREGILERITTSIGVDIINETVLSKIREWLKSALSDKLEKNSCDEESYNVKSVLAVISSYQNDYELAERHLSECLKFYQKTKGKNHARTFQIQSELAIVCWKTGNFSRAQQLCEEAFRQLKKTFGFDSAITLRSLNLLAVIAQDLGDLKKSLKLQKQCYEKRKAVLGENHLDTLKSLNNLATVYEEIGDEKQAEQFYYKALEISRIICGSDHPETFTILYNLAGLYASSPNPAKNRWPEAIELLNECIVKSRRIYGKNHTETIQVMTSLAIVHKKQQYYEMALQTMKECQEQQLILTNDQHPAYINQLNIIGDLYLNMGMLQESEESFLECLKRQTDLYGEFHPDTLQTMQNLADLFKESFVREKDLLMESQTEQEREERQKKANYYYQQSESYYTACLRIRKKLDERSPYKEDSNRRLYELLSSFAELYDKNDEQQKMEDLYERVLGASKKV